MTNATCPAVRNVQIDIQYSVLRYFIPFIIRLLFYYSLLSSIRVYRNYGNSSVEKYVTRCNGEIRLIFNLGSATTRIVVDRFYIWHINWQFVIDVSLIRAKIINR